jgi:nucleoside-triphosphatase
MPQNFFITGEPKTGKTTLLKDLIKELRKRGLKVGGFISPEERHHGTRTAFHVMDVESKKKEVLASVDGDGPKISKYHVNIKAFESIALPAMRNVDSYDVFVIDEIGRMELKSKKFINMMDKVFDSPTPVIAALHRDFVKRYAVSGETLKLTIANRNSVYYKLLRNTKGSLKKRRKVVRTKPSEKKKVKKAKAKRARAKREKPKPVEKKKKGFFDHVKELLGF